MGVITRVEIALGGDPPQDGFDLSASYQMIPRRETRAFRMFILVDVVLAAVHPRILGFRNFAMVVPERPVVFDIAMGKPWSWPVQL